MDDRRTFLALLAALMPASLTTLDAQAPATTPTAPRVIARHTLAGPFEAYDALLFELRPAPGEGRDHKHTGPVLGYVLEGRVRFAVDQGPERIVAAGETFFEPTGAVHSTFGSVDGTQARVLVFMVVPKGTNGTVAAL